MVTSQRKRIWQTLLGWAAVLGILFAHYVLSPWGYYWKTDPVEQKIRDAVVQQAEAYLGISEADGSHMQIIEKYNSQAILPVDYRMNPNDSWCAAFVTVVAMEQHLTDIIPPECSCQRQIELFKALGRWEERDNTVPLPGDILYYDWEERNIFSDCTGWSDHVGIVVGTKWPFIKVIEGNKDDSVCYRYILINDVHIRGYGKPDYASKNIP